MPAFLFEARDPSGQEQRGTLDAANAGQLATTLRARGWLVLDVKPGPDSKDAAAGDRTSPAQSLSLPPSRIDVETGLKQIALMLDSGLTLLGALRSSAEHARRASWRRIMQDVTARIERGTSFADSVAVHPRQFPPLVQELIRSGEHSGTLDQSLRRAASHLEMRRELRNAVGQALLYPVIVITLTVLVAGVMVLNVIPKLESFLLSSSNELPAITQALLDASHWFRDWGPYLAVFLPATIIAIIMLDRYLPTRRVLDAIVFRIPIVGTVRRLSSTALFARSMSVLLGAGITLVHSLGIVARILPRPTTFDAIERARERVLQGSPLASGLVGSPAFAPILTKMVGIGEETGNLDRVLDDAASYHELELQAWIKRASFIIEPVITLVVGGIVGFVYIAFFVALFSLAGGA